MVDYSLDETTMRSISGNVRFEDQTVISGGGTDRQLRAKNRQMIRPVSGLISSWVLSPDQVEVQDRPF